MFIMSALSLQIVNMQEQAHIKATKSTRVRILVLNKPPRVNFVCSPGLYLFFYCLI